MSDNNDTCRVRYGRGMLFYLARVKGSCADVFLFVLSLIKMYAAYKLSSRDRVMIVELIMEPNILKYINTMVHNQYVYFWLFQSFF